MSEKIFVDWDAKTTANWGKEIVQIGHRLHNSPLFTDEALARLIETYPREHYDLHTMTVAESGHHAESWREGDLGSSSGEEVLGAIKNGNIWLNLRKVMLVSEPYRALLEQIFSEVEGNIPLVVFSPDGRRVATPSVNHSARVWDAATGQPRGEIGHALREDTVFGPLLSPVGDTIVTRSSLESVRIWDVQTGEPLTGDLVHSGLVQGFQWGRFPPARHPTPAPHGR